MFMNFLWISLDEKGGALMHVYMGTYMYSQPLLKNRLMDDYETW